MPDTPSEPTPEDIAKWREDQAKKGQNSQRNARLSFLIFLVATLCFNGYAYIGHSLVGVIVLGLLGAGLGVSYLAMRTSPPPS